METKGLFAPFLVMGQQLSLQKKICQRRKVTGYKIVKSENPIQKITLHAFHI